MKTFLKPGTKVRFKIPDSCLAKITDHKKSYDWKVPGYLGEGFYLIETIPDNRKLVAHEDDIEKVD